MTPMTTTAITVAATVNAYDHRANFRCPFGRTPVSEALGRNKGMLKSRLRRADDRSPSKSVDELQIRRGEAPSLGH
jgi:hypothetical protein